MKMWQLVGQGVEVAVNMQGGALDLQKHHVSTKGWGYNAKESHICQGWGSLKPHLPPQETVVSGASLGGWQDIHLSWTEHHQLKTQTATNSVIR